jgi:hypothetical protein
VQVDILVPGAREEQKGSREREGRVRIEKFEGQVFPFAWPPLGSGRGPTNANAQDPAITDRKFNRLCEPKVASALEASEGQRAGQGSTETGAPGVGTRFGGVWEEIAGAAGRREIRGGGTRPLWQKMAVTRRHAGRTRSLGQVVR